MISDSKKISDGPLKKSTPETETYCAPVIRSSPGRFTVQTERGVRHRNNSGRSLNSLNHFRQVTKGNFLCSYLKFQDERNS